MQRKSLFVIVFLALTLILVNIEASPEPKVNGVVIEGVWESIGPDGGDMHFVYVTKDQILFASHGFGGVWRSTDLGETWELIYNPEWIDLNFLAMAEADGVIFGGGNYGIWKSYDGGETWSRVVTGDSYLDSSPSSYEVVSLVALSENHIYFSVRLNKEAISKGFRLVKHGFFELKDGELKFYELPEEASIYVVVMIAYDQDFSGRNLMFVSSSESGLYVYDFSTGEWEKILDKKTTRVSIDYENDYVYVGTIGDWYYRGKLSNGEWSWEHITVPGKQCPVAGFIAPDPYNPERLWIGTETGVRGSLYRTGSKERNVPTFVGVGFWKNGKWYDLRIDPGWAPTIAIVRHKEGEDPSNYIIETEYGVGARIAFVPRPAKGNIEKTEDGGETWERSYNGIYGDTINKITLIESGLRKGHIVVTCVSGTQITRDLGDSWEEGIDFTIGDIGYGMPGYAWGAASPNEKLEGRYDLLVATGYPPSYFTGNGVYAVDTESLKSRSGDKPIKRIVEGAAYDLVVVGDTLYVGSMDSGVVVVDLKTYSTSKLGCIPEDEAGINVKYYDGVLLVSTIKGGRKDMDNYFFSDKRATGGVYVVSDGKCSTVYKGKRAISVALHDNELVILTVEGKVIHYTNFDKDWEVQLPEATYSDMAIDWDNRVVFFSTFDTDNPGVLYGDLDHLEAGLKPLEGIMTRRVRCLLFVENYLFAGTEGHSVWRFKITKIYRTTTTPTYTLTLSLSSTSVNVGDTVTLSGEVEPVVEGTVKILLSINGSEYSEVSSVSLSNGKYVFHYTPQEPGTYAFKAICYDESNNLVAESAEKILTVSRKPGVGKPEKPEKPRVPEKIKPSITISVNREKVRVGEEVKVSGTISPPIPKAKVVIVINGPKGEFTHPVAVSKGQFSFTFKPTEKGVWTIYAEVEETPKSEAARSNTVTLNVEESRCIIATVAFGSEISPEVNFLRNFRDTYILSTFAGRSFYTAFNAFYYSWSPYVASAIRGSEVAKAVVRVMIYPLLGILKVAATLSLPLFYYSPELASIIAGFIASTLIGAVYVAPITYLALSLFRRRKCGVRSIVLVCLALIVVISLGFTWLGIVSLNEELTMIATSTYVLALISLSAFLTLNLLAKLQQYVATHMVYAFSRVVRIIR